MYLRHFQLAAEPFSLTPDPAFLYLSPGHAEALAALKIGLMGRRGLMVMTGEVGTGKTTLLYSWLTQLAPNVHSAYVSNTRLPFDAMLRQALADFGVPTDSRERVELLNRLNDFLLHCASEGAVAALVVDEAQNLDDDTFENLRLLSNFETLTAKLLQIVLVGQPELDTRLRQPHLRQVADRVAVHCHINPLTRRERRNYVAHRLDCAGGLPELFTRGALRLLVRHCEGIPRRINILCHNALLFAYGRDAQDVTATHMRAAVREWQGKGLTTFARRRFRRVARNVACVPSRRRLWWQPTAATVAVLAITGAVAAGRWNNPPAGGHASDAVPLDEADDSAPRVQRLPAKTEAVAISGLEPLATAPPSTGQAAEPPAEPPAAHVTNDPAAPASAAGTQEAPRFLEVRVPQGATLAALARPIYGELTPAILDRIKRANVGLVDVNHILAGDTLRFPVAAAPAGMNTTATHE